MLFLQHVGARKYSNSDRLLSSHPRSLLRKSKVADIFPGAEAVFGFRDSTAPKFIRLTEGCSLRAFGVCEHRSPECQRRGKVEPLAFSSRSNETTSCASEIHERANGNFLCPSFSKARMTEA